MKMGAFSISIYSILLFDVLNNVAFAFISGSLLYLKILCSIFLFKHFVSCIDHIHSLFTRGDISLFLKKKCSQTCTGGASCGPKGAMPLALQILHVMNSDFDTVHYCSKRAAPSFF